MLLFIKHVILTKPRWDNPAKILVWAYFGVFSTSCLARSAWLRSGILWDQTGIYDKLCIARFGGGGGGWGGC